MQAGQRVEENSRKVRFFFFIEIRTSDAGIEDTTEGTLCTVTQISLASVGASSPLIG